MVTGAPVDALRSSNFWPIFSKPLPLHDISRLLPGGPTAWDARLASAIATFMGERTPDASATITLFAGSIPAEGSRIPNGLRPLKMLFARPSQKLRKLNIALITVGVLRGSTAQIGRAHV